MSHTLHCPFGIKNQIEAKDDSWLQVYIYLLDTKPCHFSSSWSVFCKIMIRSNLEHNEKLQPFIFLPLSFSKKLWTKHRKDLNHHGKCKLTILWNRKYFIDKEKCKGNVFLQVGTLGGSVAAWPLQEKDRTGGCENHYQSHGRSHSTTFSVVSS